MRYPKCRKYSDLPKVSQLTSPVTEPECREADCIAVFTPNIYPSHKGVLFSIGKRTTEIKRILAQRAFLRDDRDEYQTLPFV